MGHNRVQKERERNMQSKDKIKYKRYVKGLIHKKMD